MMSRPLPEGHHHLGSDISSLKASTSSNPRRCFPTRWKEPSLTQNSDWKSLMFLFPSTWPGFASLGQIIHPPKKPVLAISLPSSAVCVTLSPRQLVLLGNLFVGVCSSHPRPFRKAPLVISFSCLRFTGLKSSSLTPSRGCQFELDQTRGTFPRISVIPILPRWLKLTCAHGVGCLSPSQLHGVLDVCVLSRSVVFPVQPHGLWPTSSSVHGIYFFFLEFSRQDCWSGLPFPTPGDLPGPGMASQALASPALAVRFFTTGTTTVCYSLFFFPQDEALPTKPLLISPGWSVMHFCLGTYSSTLIISLARLP